MREINRREFFNRTGDVVKKGAKVAIGLELVQHLDPKTVFAEAQVPERIEISEARSVGRIPGGIIAGWDGDDRLAIVHFTIDTKAQLRHTYDDNTKELDPTTLKALLNKDRLRERASFNISGQHVDNLEIGPEGGTWRISDLVLAEEVDITI